MLRAPVRVARRDTAVLAGLVLAGVGVPLWLSAAAGAVGLPSNDDWVYVRGAASLYLTGRVDLPGHYAASIGQLVLVQPLLWLSGGNPWAFTAFGLAMAFVAVVATYLLARRFVGTGAAVMVVLLMEAFPGMAREAATFMTDVPTYALIALCLWLGTRWLQGDGGRLSLVASVAAGLLAVGIREFAVVAPVAVLAAAWVRNRADERLLLAGVSGVFVVGAVGILIAAFSVPGGGPPMAPEVGEWGLLGSFFATLAAVLLPATVLGIGRRMATLRPEQIVLAAGVVCVVVFLPYGTLVGDLWTPIGLGGDLLLSGTRAPVIGATAWALSSQFALLAAILLAALALDWSQRNLSPRPSVHVVLPRVIRIARRPDAPLLLFLAAYAAELVLFTAVSYPLDRYLYPMVPAAAILLLQGPSQPLRLGRRHAIAHAAFVWLAASALVVAANSFAYDAARWRGGEAAVAMGYAPQAVDAGYEWVGYHATGPEGPGAIGTALTGYGAMWPSFRPCAVLSNSPLDVAGFQLIHENRSAYRQYLFFGPEEPLYLYGSTAPGCPTPPRTIARTIPLGGRVYTAAVSPGSWTGERGSREAGVS